MADAPTKNSNQASSPKKSGYGKRPMWQWIVIYLIIAIILYGGVAYYLVHRHSSTNTGNSTTNSNSLY